MILTILYILASIYVTLTLLSSPLSLLFFEVAIFGMILLLITHNVVVSKKQFSCSKYFGYIPYVEKFWRIKILANARCLNILGGKIEAIFPNYRHKQIDRSIQTINIINSTGTTFYIIYRCESQRRDQKFSVQVWSCVARPIYVPAAYRCPDYKRRL